MNGSEPSLPFYIWLLLALILGLIGRHIANSKRRSKKEGFLRGFVLWVLGIMDLYVPDRLRSGRSPESITVLNLTGRKYPVDPCPLKVEDLSFKECVGGFLIILTWIVILIWF